MKTVILAMLALALAAPAIAGELRKSGNCTLPEIRRDSGEWKSFPVSLGDSEIHVQCDFMGEEFPPQSANMAVPPDGNLAQATFQSVFSNYAAPIGYTNVTVWYAPKLTNKLNKTLNVLFFVAFFDKDGNLLVTGNTVIINLDPKQDSDAAQMRTLIPRAAFRRIASYKLVVYTTPLDSRPNNPNIPAIIYYPVQGN